jgi:hypothetical protein
MYVSQDGGGSPSPTLIGAGDICKVKKVTDISIQQINLL